ncbi:hypothetical protein [Metabacillus litoralis]|uniref:hypothetical protein n=1 Tax=Metabacillus litoralis TaxID=152268 RepID=UPI001CFD23FF|nr:hypothetical protein [Metabacillus litoralis]
MERFLDINELEIKVVQYNDTFAGLLQRYPSLNSNMDNYVLSKSTEDKLEGKALTFLFVNKEEDYLYGYYSLFATSIVYSDDDSGEFLGIPSIELKLFAINEALSGEEYESSSDGNRYKYSDILIGSIIGKIYEYAEEHIGIQAIVLRSTNKAVNFYLRNKFDYFQDMLMLPYDEFSKDCVPMIFVL